MNINTLLCAINEIDDKMIDEHMDKMEKNAALREKKKHKVKKWLGGAVTASLSVILLGLFILRFIPKQYELAYSYKNEAGYEIGLAQANVWVSYLDGPFSKKELVKLPDSPENIFLTWKYLNHIGDDVQLLECRIDDNSSTSSSVIEGQPVVHHQVGDRFVMNIVISESIKTYADGEKLDKLLDTLKHSLADHSALKFDEVNIFIK